MGTMRCGLCAEKSEKHLCGRCVLDAGRAHRRDVLEQRKVTDALQEAALPKLMARAQAASLARNMAKLRTAVEAGEAILEEKKKHLVEEKTRLAERRSALGTWRKQLEEAHAQLELDQQALSNRGETGAQAIVALETQAAQTAGLVAAARKRLVMQLVELFPLDAQEETIANLRMPSDIKTLRDMNPDAVSAAIAVTVRVLRIAASYLSLPLPYPFEFRGSVAWIGPDKDSMVALPGQGLATESGLIMLRRNVEALCFYQGVPRGFVTNESSIVHGMWQLFHSPSLGNSVHQSLTEADARVARVPAGKPLRSPVVEPGILMTTRVSDRASAGLKVKSKPRPASPRARLLSKHPDVDLAASMLSASSMSMGSFGSADLSESQELALALAPGGEAWDLIERPQPPKPSKDDDIEHWISSGAGATGPSM